MVGDLRGAQGAYPDHSAGQGAASMWATNWLRQFDHNFHVFCFTQSSWQHMIKDETLHPSSTRLQIKLGNLTWLTLKYHSDRRQMNAKRQTKILLAAFGGCLSSCLQSFIHLWLHEEFEALAVTGISQQYKGLRHLACLKWYVSTHL